MKITGNQGLIIDQTIKNDKKNGSEKNNFQSIMDNLTSASESKDVTGVTASAQAPFISSTGIVFTTEPITGTTATLDKDEVLGSLKDTLDLVDTYASKLSDSSLSADSLSPIVEELEQRMDLLKDMESSAGANDTLKSILSDVTATMGAEIERFKRGDYV